MALMGFSLEGWAFQSLGLVTECDDNINLRRESVLYGWKLLIGSRDVRNIDVTAISMVLIGEKNMFICK